MSLTLFRTLALGAVLSLGAAACGDGADTTSDADAIATLGADASDTDGGSEASSGGSPDAPDDPELAFALYDECMAEHGVTIETAVGDDSGSLSVDDQTLELDDPQSEGLDSLDDLGDAFDEADAACAKHLANIDGGFDLNPEQQALLEDAQLEWAACMRDKGIDIPDIDASGGAIAIEMSPEPSDPQSGDGFGGADFDFEAFDEANQACESAFDALDESLGSIESEG